MNARFLATLLVWCMGASLVSCGNSHMTMDGTMTGNLNGAMRLEGPIQIQMAGPSVTYEGTYVSEALFKRIAVNETTGEWIIAIIGPPTASTTLSTGAELWRWNCQPSSEQVSMLTVLSVGDKTEPQLRRSLVVVELRNGVVVDKWRE